MRFLPEETIAEKLLCLLLAGTLSFVPALAHAQAPQPAAGDAPVQAPQGPAPNATPPESPPPAPNGPPSPPKPGEPGPGEPTTPLAPPAEPAPPAAAPPVPLATQPPVVTPPVKPARLEKDELDKPGYVPGYRRYLGLGLSAFAPQVGALPGGVTPPYFAPTRPDDWTFAWSGYMTASLQPSINTRSATTPGQSKVLLHTPPHVVDEYASFVSTNDLPGNWVGMNFSYGNRFVTATVSIDTWNPTRPTNYYQLGSQYFINNAYLSFRAPPIDNLRLQWNVGFFSSTYGNLSRYGGGIYVNPLIGQPYQTAGEVVSGEYDLADRLTLVFEHGFRGQKIGKVPDGVVPNGANNSANPNWPAAYIHHAHIGINLKGNVELQARLNYMTQWAQDDRTQRPVDNPATTQLDESYVRDPRITVWGVDARLSHPGYGFLGAGVAYIRGHDAYPLRGFNTYAGDGERLTNVWWGAQTTGTGKLIVAALNYTLSVAALIKHPAPWPGDGPDVVINAGFHVATTSTNYAAFDGRVRHKYGADVLYTFSRYAGVGFRADRVVPNSKDSEETFFVIAPRVQFRTGWYAHEAIVLSYVKWFYGAHTHTDAGGGGGTLADRLDDQVLALNFNMYW